MTHIEQVSIYTKRFGNKTIMIDRSLPKRTEPTPVDDPIWPLCGGCWHRHLRNTPCGHKWSFDTSGDPYYDKCECTVGYLSESD